MEGAALRVTPDRSGAAAFVLRATRVELASEVSMLGTRRRLSYRRPERGRVCCVRCCCCWLSCVRFFDLILITVEAVGPAHTHCSQYIKPNQATSSQSDDVGGCRSGATRLRASSCRALPRPCARGTRARWCCAGRRSATRRRTARASRTPPRHAPPRALQRLRSGARACRAARRAPLRCVRDLESDARWRSTFLVVFGSVEIELRAAVFDLM